tara:strand:+ start:595 stop:1245 length:651 start_codon:yes stop_codon:yes gene_type:complete
MSKYGYIGKDGPTQAIKSSAGVLNTKEHSDLVRDDKLFVPGQLELIESKTITSATAAMEFLDIKSDIYDTHFLTFTNFQPETNDNSLGLRYSNDGGTTYLASNYEFAWQYVIGSTFAINHSNSSNILGLCSNAGNSGTYSANGYLYFHNLGDATKQSYNTQHVTQLYRTTAAYTTHFGGGIHQDLTGINAMKLMIYSASGNILNLQASLYGIKGYS